MTPAPAHTHLVLVGGGHSHVTVIRSFGMDPEPGVVVTVVAKEVEAPYSGMLPGLVAGHYGFDDCHIDLVRLASWAGVRLVHGEVTGVDRAARRVAVRGRPPIGYDLLSIDVGITPLLGGIEGATEHALSVKPISTFVARWAALEGEALTSGGPRRIAVVGGGAAGFELILAIRHRLREQAASTGIDPEEFRFVLIGGETLLPHHNGRARALARKALESQGVELVENDRAVKVDRDAVCLSGGRTIAADAVLISTKAGPSDWFRHSGLPTDATGFLAVRPTLQLLDDDNIFAVGDCASVIEHPREKAGVFAVRQGAPLTENLRFRARGLAARPFKPQSSFLTLLATGRQNAIAARNGLAFSGDWVWHWKDRIDREFMARFNDLPNMHRDLASDDDATMRCAGCAAKVGPVTLAAALGRLGRKPAVDQDDAAIIDDGGDEIRVETIDFFRAFWPEPYVFGEIAANHAMSDVYAMGGRPTHALANFVLPFAKPHCVEEDLYQLLAGASSAFERQGVALAGGHSSEGAELAAGFFVSGQVPRGRLWQKRGLQPGDRLVLTRPIGTGILFAGLMRGLARSHAIGAALSTMRQSNGIATAVLSRFQVTAATDVTGFGLAGHLLEMLNASHVSAELLLSAVPLYPMVGQLAEAGVTSSLLPENMKLAAQIDGMDHAASSTLPILFDPQTSGGLILGIPAEAVAACLASLQESGVVGSAVIGTVLGQAGKDGPRLSLTQSASNAVVPPLKNP